MASELKHYQLFIGGEWVSPASGQVYETVNPFTEQAWALAPEGDADDIDRAVKAARP